MTTVERRHHASVKSLVKKLQAEIVRTAHLDHLHHEASVALEHQAQEIARLKALLTRELGSGWEDSDAAVLAVANRRIRELGVEVWRLSNELGECQGSWESGTKWIAENLVLRDALADLVSCDDMLRLYVEDGVIPQNYQQRCEEAVSKARDALVKT